MEQHYLYLGLFSDLQKELPLHPRPLTFLGGTEFCFCLQKFTSRDILECCRLCHCWCRQRPWLRSKVWTPAERLGNPRPHIGSVFKFCFCALTNFSLNLSVIIQNSRMQCVRCRRKYTALCIIDRHCWFQIWQMFWCPATWHYRCWEQLQCIPVRNCMSTLAVHCCTCQYNCLLCFDGSFGCFQTSWSYLLMSPSGPVLSPFYVGFM